MNRESSLYKKLKAYSAFAGAMLSPVLASGQIVYTDVVPDDTISSSHWVPRDSAYLDLNNDGQPDFKLRVTHASSGSYTGYSGWWRRGSDASIIPMSQNEMEISKSMSTSSVGCYNKIVPINLNDTIGPLKNFGINGLLASEVQTGTSISWASNTSWNGCGWGIDKFFGLKVIIQGNVYYGWVRLDVDAGELILKDYAINAISGSSILGGEQSVLTSVSTQADHPVITLAPNPTTNTILIEGGNSQLIRVEIRDLLGKTIHTETLYRKEILIDIGHLTPGIYLTEITMEDDKRVVKKFIKE